jgi:membrane-associated phospholipid phosphatase
VLDEGDRVSKAEECSTPVGVNAKRWVKRLAEDERNIWTSPDRVRSRDARWLLMLGGTAASLFAVDHTIMQHNTLSPATLRRSVDFSNYGLGALVGVGGALFLWGNMTGDDHKQETGLLSGESALSAFVASMVLGDIFARERPGIGGAQGSFFRGGTSFPSDHSAVAWSIASMIAHQYPGPLTKLFAYGLAGAVSVSRVTGNQHFPSDVFVGGAMGWLTAQEMYHKHHDPNLGGEAWGGPSGNDGGEESKNPPTLASPYVSLDSWIYPALERLVALNYIRTEFLGLRPWTRAECARLVEEAGEIVQEEESGTTEANRIYGALEREFASELHPGAEPVHSLHTESLYTRMLGISGQPLNDSYHFGQTIINDFGRPYAEGVDPVSGFSGWANWGRFALYMRGEYQHSPSAPAYSQDVRDLIAQVDDNPVLPARFTPTINQFTLLDTYALTKLGNWNLSFGEQSLWWGPGEGGALLFSDNAAPIYMFRTSRDAPFTLPWIFRSLGPVKLDAFVGKLSGNEFPPRPLLHGEKISFKPTPNLEFGFTRTTEFGGVGRVLTPLALFRSYFSVHSSDLYPANANPGKRTAGFEFSYKVPHLRNWLTLYDDALLPEDNPTNFDMSKSPIYAPRRAAMRPGLYLAQVPHLHKLDCRVEAVYTDPPTLRSQAGQYIYFNNFYHDLYTNKGNLIGDWIGREGKGYQGWTTYWFNPRTSLQFGYRHAQVASDFIPHGETLNDGSVKVNWQIQDELTLSAFVQYEKWLAPVLALNARNNVTTSLQLTFYPRHWGLWK